MRAAALYVAALVLLSAGGGRALKRRGRAAKAPPAPQAVSEGAASRGLTAEKLSHRALVEQGRQYSAATGNRTFQGETLAFVTPWNSRSYDVAKMFPAKFTYVAPVWLQARRGSGGDVEITGQHDIDAGWMADVRRFCADPDPEQRACPRIVPRLALEMAPPGREEGPAVAAQVADLLEQRGFDGVVLEMTLNPASLDLLHHLANALHTRTAARAGLSPSIERDIGADGEVSEASPADADAMQLLLVLPPSRGPQRMNQGVLARLAHSADRFIVMTYDFSVAQGPGPNAPLPWVRQTAHDLLGPRPASSPLASRLLLGLAFYGYDEQEAVVGPQFLELLARYRPRLQWDKGAEEHFVQYRPRGGAVRTVYFPTPASVQRRLDLAASLGTGVGFWEVGQGLESFYDLL